MSSSKLRPEQQTDEIRPWLPPEMEGERKPERPADEVEMEDAELPAPPTAEELEAVRQQAYEEGFEKGKEDGFEFGHKEGAAAGARADASSILRAWNGSSACSTSRCENLIERWRRNW